MSAYVVERDTINEIVSTMIAHGLATLDTADYVGQCLVNENVQSVAYLRSHMLSRVGVDDEYSYYPTPATIGQRARSLSNYLYQSCEHPSWQSSEARQLCVALAVALLAEIPGFGDAVTR